MLFNTHCTTYAEATTSIYQTRNVSPSPHTGSSILFLDHRVIAGSMSILLSIKSLGLPFVAQRELSRLVLEAIWIGL